MPATERPHRRSRRGIAAVLTLVLLLSVTTPGAPAAATGDHRTGGGTCLARVDRRLALVDELTSKVASAPDVHDAHRAALRAGLAATKDDLLALRHELFLLDPSAFGGMTTGEHGEHGSEHGEHGPSPEMVALCRRVTELRVFSLRKPQVHLVLAAARVVGRQPQYEQLAAALDHAITFAGAGSDVAKARQKLDSHRAHIAAAVAGASGVGDAVAGLGPADWTQDHHVLAPHAATMHQVKHELKAAGKDARAIIELVWLGPGNA